jgi:hypothetical protein
MPGSQEGSQNKQHQYTNDPSGLHVNILLNLTAAVVTPENTAVVLLF